MSICDQLLSWTPIIEQELIRNIVIFQFDSFYSTVYVFRIRRF